MYDHPYPEARHEWTLPELCAIGFVAGFAAAMLALVALGAFR